MLKQSVQLEVKIGERIYTLQLPLDCPLGEVHDALFKMRCYIVERINEMQRVDEQKPCESDSQQEDKIEG